MDDYQVTLTVRLTMRVEASSAQEAQALVLTHCFSPRSAQIHEIALRVLEQDAIRVDEE